MANASPEPLRQAVFEHVAECRHQLKEGHADLSRLEGMVLEYCLAIARLPKDEGQRHEGDLKTLMQAIEALGVELEGAKEAVRMELSGLGRLKQANVAYNRSDAILPAVTRKNEDE